MNQMMMQRMMANPAMQNMFNNQRCGMLASSNNNRQGKLESDFIELLSIIQSTMIFTNYI